MVKKKFLPSSPPSDLSHNASCGVVGGVISRLNNSTPLIFARPRRKEAVSSGGLLDLRSLSSYCYKTFIAQLSYKILIRKQI